MRLLFNVKCCSVIYYVLYYFMTVLNQNNNKILPTYCKMCVKNISSFFYRQYSCFCCCSCCLIDHELNFKIKPQLNNSTYINSIIVSNKLVFTLIERYYVAQIGIYIYV